MTLEQIRQTTKASQLRPAIKYLCDNMQAMSWGAFVAYQRTLETQSVKLGISLKELNSIAENYQVYGTMEDLK